MARRRGADRTRCRLRDIGTSTLYGLKQAVQASGAPTPDGVMGIVSLILWALLLIVALKYAILILRADNHGEGGIVALLALLEVRQAPRGSWRASLLIVGLIAAALLYGDGVITPAISVLSAVEGLKVDAPGLAPMVVPITIANHPSRMGSRPKWPISAYIASAPVTARKAEPSTAKAIPGPA